VAAVLMQHFILSDYPATVIVVGVIMVFLRFFCLSLAGDYGNYRKGEE
jgi:hypothetical protein